MSARLDKIIELIMAEADTVKNKDPIAQLYNVEMQIQTRVIEEMVKILERKRDGEL